MPQVAGDLGGQRQIVTDLKLASEITKRLAPLNVKLAIDDFGRGYSSLVRLKELPFAELKLDRNFVADCGTDKVNAPLCKTVIDLAHNFGSIAVAIGIEKAADAMALVSMGCDYGQGFLLGQPMPEYGRLAGEHDADLMLTNGGHGAGDDLVRSVVAAHGVNRDGWPRQGVTGPGCRRRGGANNERSSCGQAFHYPDDPLIIGRTATGVCRRSIPRPPGREAR